MGRRKSFRSWLQENKTDGVVGILAAELLTDDDFPWQSTMGDLRTYLQGQGFTPDHLRNFDIAVALYESYVGIRLIYVGGPVDGAVQRFDVHESIPDRQVIDSARLIEMGLIGDSTLVHVYRRTRTRYIHAGVVKAPSK